MSVLKIDDGSVLMLKYTYVRNGAGTVWDLGGMYLADGAQNRKWIGLLRRVKPSAAMPEESMQAWRTMTAGTHPWEGVPFLTGGRTEVNAMVNKKEVAAGKTNTGYTMTLSYEGNQLGFINIHEAFLALERGLTVVE